MLGDETLDEVELIYNYVVALGLAKRSTTAFDDFIAIVIAIWILVTLGGSGILGSESLRCFKERSAL